MYVSQVSATVLYTVLKTILLILLTQTIYSICAWMNRYDLAKIFEQGNVTVLIESLTSNRYSKYRGMFLCLFIAIAFEVVINLLPTIATKYMPFESVIISDDIPKYFEAKFSTPIQSVPVSSYNDTMDAYCQDMELCNSNTNYFDNKVNISYSMKVTPIFPIVTEKNILFKTKFCNISFKNLQNSILNSGYIVYNKSLNLNVNLFNDKYNGLEVFIPFSINPTISYKNNSYLLNYNQQIVPFIYNPLILRSASIVNRADLIYSDGKNNVILVMKFATYGSWNIDNIPQYNIFNNSQLLYDLSIKNSSKYINGVIAHVQYMYQNFWVNDYIQTSGDIVSKARVLLSVHVINDENFNNNNYNMFNNSILTIYNISHTDAINSILYSSIFEQSSFNNPPTNDLFMYAVISRSNGYMYGIQGNREIVANISPIFIGILVSIIILLIIVCVLSKYIKDKLYFSTLLETISLSNLPNINKKEILLDKSEED